MAMRQIDPEWYAVIDQRSGDEIPGAVGADEDTGEVHYIRATYDGPEKVSKFYPHGVRVVRRRTRTKLNPNVFGKR